jgi:hypothetical protein
MIVSLTPILSQRERKREREMWSALRAFFESDF